MPSRRVLVPVLSCLATLAVCTGARADSYKLYDVYGTGNGSSATIGITDAGLDLVRTPLSSNPYLTFDGSTGTSVFSATAPNLVFDNGTSCSITNNGSFTVISGVVCNNGRVAFIGSTNTIRQGVFLGLDPLNDLLYNGLSGGIRLDATGDIGFNSFASSSSSTDNNYFAYDVTSRITPEPSSFLLLASGAGSLLALYRRRISKP